MTAYDGITDYSGTSGKTYSTITNSTNGTFNSSNPSDLSIFTGTGNIFLPVSAVGDSNFTGTANLATQVDTKAGSNVSIVYSYISQDLSINKTHTGIFTATSNGLYTITVNNKDNQPTAGQITVVDTLPNGLSFVSNTNPDWACAAVGQTLTCTSSLVIPALGSSIFDVSVNVAQNTASSITNQVQVSSTLIDSFLSDNTKTDPTIVNHLPTPNDSTISPISNTNPYKIPNTTLGGNANDVGDSLTSYIITTLPDSSIGVLYLGNPSSGGTLISTKQVLSPTDILNIYFSPVAGSSGNTTFNYIVIDSFSGVSALNGTINLSVTNTPTTSGNNTVVTFPSNPQITPQNTQAVINYNIEASQIASNNFAQNISPATNQSKVLGVKDIVENVLVRTGGGSTLVQLAIQFGLIIIFGLGIILLKLSQKR